MFALTAEGWAIVERREFHDAGSAFQWMKRRTNTLAMKNPAQRVRGSIVPVKGWYTLDMALADYEAKRQAGDPEFSK